MAGIHCSNISHKRGAIKGIRYIECEAARVGLTRKRLSGTAEAWSFANEMTSKAGVVPLNSLTISRRKTKWRRGTYWGGTRKRIVLYPHTGGDSLTTPVHEIAHHIARENYGRAVRPHGEEFKRAFKWRLSELGGFAG